MKVSLVTKTSGSGEFEGKSIDEIIVGQARVSSGKSGEDLFKDADKLIKYCILNAHMSIFELANLGFEIETSRAIGRELLRHGKLAGLTEFSQRYSSDIIMEDISLRKQSVSNRQSSEEDWNPMLSQSDGIASDLVENSISWSKRLYLDLINNGVARETARFILPECTSTKIFINFRVRELITFLNARLHKTAQKEIREIAEKVRDIFIKECPIISKALFNFENAYEHHILDQLVLEKYKVRGEIIGQ